MSPVEKCQRASAACQSEENGKKLEVNSQGIITVGRTVREKEIPFTYVGLHCALGRLLPILERHWISRPVSAAKTQPSFSTIEIGVTGPYRRTSYITLQDMGGGQKRLKKVLKVCEMERSALTTYPGFKLRKVVEQF